MSQPEAPTQDALRRFKADIFQALAHPTRIAIIDLMREGEVSAGHFPVALGVEPANASQHLAILRSKGIVRNRKEGNQVFYALRDPILVEVLDILRRYFETQLTESLSMLQQIHDEGSN